MKPKRILFPTDFSASSQVAFTHALYQAELYGSELHILHNVHWDEQGPLNSLPDADEIVREMQKLAQVKMVDLCKRSANATFEIVEATQLGADPAKLIIEYIVAQQIGLVVMGTHGRKGVTHFLLGSVAEEVARLAPCPVITVREGGSRAELSQVKQILAPVDYSIQSKHALHLAREIAAKHKADLHLLFVVHEFECGFGNTKGGMYEFNNLLPQIVTQQKMNLGDFYRDMPGMAVPHSLAVEVGAAAPKIVAYAKAHEIDYIVMGTHGFGGFNHLILGSTTERVIRMAPCPVLSMKLRT